ncbi:MAG TPA: nitroreductase/quinone reductase family protein [Acidimicrobiia bacterium]
MTTTTTTGTTTGTTTSGARYVEPGRFTRTVFNPVFAWLTRRGVGMRGARVLHVQGRTSGAWHTTVVNPLTVDGHTYLVAPRGTTQWVRNLRASGECRLQLGRRVDTFTTTELADADKPELLRAYLSKWQSEVKVFFDGVTPDAPREDLVRIAPGYPVFRIDSV